MGKGLVVITGASSGIGLALARVFGAAGHPLLMIARRMEPLPDFAGRLVRYASADVADYEAFEQAVRGAEQDFGATDCLVNAAGFVDARPLEEVSPADYVREVRTNLLGVMNGIKVVLAGMKARQGGTIINVSSVSDRKTAPVALAYTASKYGVRAVSESLQEAEGRNGIRVMNIAPGYVKTKIHEKMGISFEDYCRRLGNPDFMSAEELAGIILFCYQLPPHICIRDLVVAPTKTTF